MLSIIDFGRFRLEYGVRCKPGEEKITLWLINNDIEDGLVVDPDDIDKLLQKHYVENM